MVDSRKGKTMTDGLQDLPDRVQAVEQKVDALSTSVDARFDQVDAAIAPRAPARPQRWRQRCQVFGRRRALPDASRMLLMFRLAANSCFDRIALIGAE